MPKCNRYIIGVFVRSILLYNREFVTVASNWQLLVSQKDDAASGALATEWHQYIEQLANTSKKQGKYYREKTLLKC